MQENPRRARHSCRKKTTDDLDAVEVVSERPGGGGIYSAQSAEGSVMRLCFSIACSIW